MGSLNQPIVPTNHRVQEGLPPTENSRQCDTQLSSVSLALKAATTERKQFFLMSRHHPGCSSGLTLPIFSLNRQESVISSKQHFHLQINHTGRVDGVGEEL